MPHLLKIPQVSERRESLTLAKVFVVEGDLVQIDQPIAELDAGKATLSIESEVVGTIAYCAAGAGVTLETDSVFAVIALPGENVDSVRRDAVAQYPFRASPPTRARRSWISRLLGLRS